MVCKIIDPKYLKFIECENYVKRMSKKKKEVKNKDKRYNESLDYVVRYKIELGRELVRSINRYCMNNNKDYFYRSLKFCEDKVYYSQYSKEEYKDWLEMYKNDFVKKIVDGKEYIYRVNYGKTL